MSETAGFGKDLVIGAPMVLARVVADHVMLMRTDPLVSVEEVGLIDAGEEIEEAVLTAEVLSIALDLARRMAAQT
jgi:hypothetical protein